MEHEQINIRQFKKLYVVRHGQTDFNHENRSQPATAGLSLKGQDQAKLLAQRFRNFAVIPIISSDMERASATARAIAEVNGGAITFSELFREVKRPSEIIGKLFADPAVNSIRLEMYAHAEERMWHYSDEENMFDLYARALRARHLLEEFSGSHHIVVSHRVFIVMFFCALITEEEYAAMSLYWNIRRHMHLDNAGMTAFELRDIDGYTQWRVRTWNDYAHLR